MKTCLFVFLSILSLCISCSTDYSKKLKNEQYEVLTYYAREVLKAVTTTDFEVLVIEDLLVGDSIRLETDGEVWRENNSSEGAYPLKAGSIIVITSLDSLVCRVHCVTKAGELTGFLLKRDLIYLKYPYVDIQRVAYYGVLHGNIEKAKRKTMAKFAISLDSLNDVINDDFVKNTKSLGPG